VDLVPLTRRTWPSLETLFGANKTVGGCWCAWYLRDNKDVQAGWGDGNKAFLHALVRADEPLGVLAIDEQPVGWVAVAPRSLYPRLDRSDISASDAGPHAWAVTCFFVHRTARRRGLGHTLLAAAVEFARERGARVVEAFPVDTDGSRRPSGDLYHGTLAMFLAGGFTLVERRGVRRALVRRELS
jgi:GNAT superfamily N-acetyltransferase